MKRIWRSDGGKTGILLLVLTFMLAGCAGTQGTDSDSDTPVFTQEPQGTVNAEEESPKETEIPQATEEAKVTQEPQATELPEETGEPTEIPVPESDEALLNIINEAYKKGKETYDGLYPEAIKALTICAATEDYISVNIAADETLSPTDYFHMEIVNENGQWNVSEFVMLHYKNGPYGEEYMPLEPLAADSVEFPEDTVVALPMGSTVAVDLNGDGIEEWVQVSFESVCGPKGSQPSSGSDYFYHDLPVVRINDYIFDEEYLRENLGHYAENADVATWYIFDVDTSDGYKEIGLFEEGPSNDPYTTLFRYEDGVLREIGGFSDCPIGEENGSWILKKEDDYQELVNAVDRSNIQIKVPGDGTVYARQRVDILETNFAEGLWMLQNGESFAEAELVLQVREVYEILWYEHRFDSEFCPRVREELQVFTERDLASELMILTQGEVAIPYRYYPDSEGEGLSGWVEIIYGEDYQDTAWVYKNDYYDSIYQKGENGEADYVSASQLIENLSHAD